LKSNVLKYQLVVFLVHVVIAQFMFLAEYPFKRHRRASLEGWGARMRDLKGPKMNLFNPKED
jgi:hypothetical protein